MRHVRVWASCIYWLHVQVIRRRLEVHNEQAKPVVNFFREKKILMDFEITGGIPETLPLLYHALKPHTGNWTIADFEVGTSA
jgi:adenylate kinase